MFIKPVVGLRMTQNVIIKCLLKYFVSFCCVPAKFEAKFNANLLLLHVHHFDEKILYVLKLVIAHFKFWEFLGNTLYVQSSF